MSVAAQETDPVHRLARYSVVVPVYGNAETLPAVIARLAEMNDAFDGLLEGVFVVDGSPDDSLEILRKLLPDASFSSQLVAHSRNFGSFAAIRTGFEYSSGEFVAAMAADLQEPAELLRQFFETLDQGEVDVVVGARTKREDPFLSSALARVFWSFYRRVVHRAIPPGGVDIFGCTRAVASRLVDLTESHSSLVGLLYWWAFGDAKSHTTDRSA